VESRSIITPSRPATSMHSPPAQKLAFRHAGAIVSPASYVGMSPATFS
jgi:hypothetical protein